MLPSVHMFTYLQRVTLEELKRRVPQTPGESCTHMYIVWVLWCECAFFFYCVSTCAQLLYSMWIRVCSVSKFLFVPGGLSLCYVHLDRIPSTLYVHLHVCFRHREREPNQCVCTPQWEHIHVHTCTYTYIQVQSSASVACVILHMYIMTGFLMLYSLFHHTVDVHSIIG